MIATLSVRATRARAVSPALPHHLGPPSTTLGPGPSTCTLVQLPGGGGRGAVATPPSVVAGSRHCIWTDHGRPSIDTTLGTDPGSNANVHHPAAAAGHFSILDALTGLVGPVAAGQLPQHNDAPDAARTYGVGRRLRCVESQHA
jgi:hypothetical protein